MGSRCDGVDKMNKKKKLKPKDRKWVYKIGDVKIIRKKKEKNNR